MEFSGISPAPSLFDAEFILAVAAVDPLVEAFKAFVDDIVGAAETADVRPQVKLDSSIDRLQVGKHG